MEGSLSLRKTLFCFQGVALKRFQDFRLKLPFPLAFPGAAATEQKQQREPSLPASWVQVPSDFIVTCFQRTLCRRCKDDAAKQLDPVQLSSKATRLYTHYSGVNPPAPKAIVSVWSWAGVGLEIGISTSSILPLASKLFFLPSAKENQAGEDA